MATLIDASEYTSNDVYQIQATDPVEGAAIDASFSGTGISNQPHQQLANRTAFLKQRQDVNSGNIGVLQAFMAEFTGSMGPNGYLEIPFADINRGSIVALVQWGSVVYNNSILNDTPITLTWPTAFPNACMWASASGMRDPARTANDNSDWGIFVVSLSKTQAQFELDSFLETGARVTPYGYLWMSIGF